MSDLLDRAIEQLKQHHILTDEMDTLILRYIANLENKKHPAGFQKERKECLPEYQLQCPSCGDNFRHPCRGSAKPSAVDEKIKEMAIEWVPLDTDLRDDFSSQLRTFYQRGIEEAAELTEALPTCGCKDPRNCETCAWRFDLAHELAERIRGIGK